MSKNSYFIVVLIIVLVVVGGVFIIGRNNKNQVIAPTRQVSDISQEVNEPLKTNRESVSSSAAPSTENNVITYTDSGYSSPVLTVRVGTTVVFKNESSGSMWTASAVHPTHSVYPIKGGCIGSTFDECRGDPPGTSWSFRFDIPGTWGYHNHLAPNQIGKVIVE